MSTVKDVVHNNGGMWPYEWIMKYDTLASINVPMLNDRDDKLWWKDEDGNLNQFSVRSVWEAIRPRGNGVAWFHVVWFSQCIPRHAFLTWLLMGERLKTQDKLRSWDVPSTVNVDDLRCPLCKTVQDSHAHLFFQCPFSTQVWFKAKNYIHIPNIGDTLSSFVAIVNGIAHRRLVRIVVAKILFSATIYYVWQERNNRLFKQKARHVDQIFDAIYSTTRLKLMSLRFKESAAVSSMRNEWRISSSS